MGKHFGNIARVNRLIYFGVSPYEQKVFKGLVTKGFPNYLKNLVKHIFIAAPGKNLFMFICQNNFVVYLKLFWFDVNIYLSIKGEQWSNG